jgi:hypothetical protein
MIDKYSQIREQQLDLFADYSAFYDWIDGLNWGEE